MDEKREKEPRSYTISLKLTRKEMDEIEKAAMNAGGIPKGTYARAMVVQAARAENAKSRAT